MKQKRKRTETSKWTFNCRLDQHMIYEIPTVRIYSPKVTNGMYTHKPRLTPCVLPSSKQTFLISSLSFILECNLQIGNKICPKWFKSAVSHNNADAMPHYTTWCTYFKWLILPVIIGSIFFQELRLNQCLSKFIQWFIGLYLLWVELAWTSFELQ